MPFWFRQGINLNINIINFIYADVQALHVA